MAEAGSVALSACSRRRGDVPPGRAEGGAGGDGRPERRRPSILAQPMRPRCCDRNPLPRPQPARTRSPSPNRPSPAATPLQKVRAPARRSPRQQSGRRGRPRRGRRRRSRSPEPGRTAERRRCRRGSRSGPACSPPVARHRSWPQRAPSADPTPPVRLVNVGPHRQHVVEGMRAIRGVGLERLKAHHARPGQIRDHEDPARQESPLCSNALRRPTRACRGGCAYRRRSPRRGSRRRPRRRRA